MNTQDMQTTKHTQAAAFAGARRARALIYPLCGLLALSTFAQAPDGQQSKEEKKPVTNAPTKVQLTCINPAAPRVAVWYPWDAAQPRG